MSEADVEIETIELKNKTYYYLADIREWKNS